MSTSRMDDVSPARRCLVMLVLTGLLVASPAIAQDQAKETDSDGIASIESLFENYLHFALIGKFDIAEQRYGKLLLDHPELNPMTEDAATTLVELSESIPDSMDILIKLIHHSSIDESAEEILDLIRTAHKRKRQDPDRIKANIKLLAGTPMERSVALERLRDSGPYAVPWMLGMLRDPDMDRLRPFIVRALSELGKPAINPLIAALEVEDQSTRQVAIRTLGRLGYPQALPYLQRIAQSEKAAEEVRTSARKAVEDIVVDNPGMKALPATQLFADLASKYYRDEQTLRADPRDDKANIWRAREDAYPGQDVVQPIEIPADIYHLVQCMDCCQSSLALTPDQPNVIALWLAANFRREAQLGLNVQSEETVDAQALDPSRPENFPRAIYFARIAGPTCSQIVLTRAIEERDQMIALGAVAALNATSGKQDLITPKEANGTSLGRALYFADLLVRVKAALALAQAMPEEQFAGSTEVVPVLSSILSPTDKPQYLVVDPDDESRMMVQEALRGDGGAVITAEQLTVGLQEAHKRFTHLDGIVLASDLTQPQIVEAIKRVAEDRRFGLAPTLVLIKPEDAMMLDRIGEADPRVGTLFVLADDEGGFDPRLVDEVLPKLKQIAGNYGYRELSPELLHSLAMQATHALRQLAIRESKVFDVSLAESALVDALRTHPSEQLRLSTGLTLSWMKSANAQNVLAARALSSDESTSIRLAMFRLLSDSARRFGSMLNQNLADELKNQAVKLPDLGLRTAASQALGALNQPAETTADIILGATR